MLDNFNLPDKTIDKIYDDAFQPAAHETGKLLGRIPRAINAVFLNLISGFFKKNRCRSYIQNICQFRLGNFASCHFRL